MSTTELTPELTELLNTARGLSQERVREVLDFALFLRLRQNGGGDDSDEWTEEDLRNHRVASLKRFEKEHGEENWGEDYSAPGGTPCPPPVT